MRDSRTSRLTEKTKQSRCGELHSRGPYVKQAAIHTLLCWTCCRPVKSSQWKPKQNSVNGQSVNWRQIGIETSEMCSAPEGVRIYFYTYMGSAFFQRRRVMGLDCQNDTQNLILVTYLGEK